MRKNAKNAGVFLAKQLAKNVRVYCSEAGITATSAYKHWIERFLVSVERGERLRLVPPDVSGERRPGTTIIPVVRSQHHRLRVVAAQHETTIRALVALAVREGLDRARIDPPPLPAAPPRPARAPGLVTRAIHHDAALVEALKPLAQARGTSVVHLVDTVLSVVVRSPGVLDHLDLPPALDVHPTEDVENAARRAVELAGGETRVQTKAPPTRAAPRGRRTRRRGIKT